MKQDMRNVTSEFISVLKVVCLNFIITSLRLVNGRVWTMQLWETIWFTRRLLFNCCKYITRYCYKHFTSVSTLVLTAALQGQYYCPIIEMRALGHRISQIRSRSPSQWQSDSSLNLGNPTPALVLSFYHWAVFVQLSFHVQVYEIIIGFFSLCPSAFPACFESVSSFGHCRR